MIVARPVGALLAAAGLAACEPVSAPHLAAPQFSNAKSVVASVTGSGHFTSSGDLRTFSFSAVKRADGSVTGEWQRYNRGLDAKGHGNVTCFAIIGNQAWLGGVAESGTLGEVAWRVVDNGEGGNAPVDQISLQFVGGGPGFAANYCAATPISPALNNVEEGNIQVRP